MTKVLEREKTGSTLERPVEIERPPAEIPPRPEPPAPRRPYVRWLGWMLVVAVIAVAGVLAAIQGDQVVLDDGSFEANELARMLSLAPEVEATLEMNLFEARVADGAAEAVSLVPRLRVNIGTMTSFEDSFPGLTEVLEREVFVSILKANIEKQLSFEASFPTVDTSFEAAELARMSTLAPEISDGSFEANELARMLRLAPETDNSFELNEVTRMLELAPEG